MASVQQLEAMIAPAVTALGFELWGCCFDSGDRRSVLRVYVDKVTIDDCAEISRQISTLLDVDDSISGRYDLEVSSPGIDRPLFSADHYRQFIGHRVKLRLVVPRDGQRNFRAIIKAVEGEQLTLQMDTEQVIVRTSEIDKANLVPDFEV